MKIDNKIESLKRVELFSSLTDDELLYIASKMVIRRFEKNEIIFHEEDTNKFMYIILHGKVKAMQTTQDGKGIILATHNSGDFFGEMSLIDGKTAPATVMAMEDSLTVIISKQDFYSLVFDQKKVLEKLLQILCSRLRESWERIEMLNLNNASQRLKMLFIMLSEKYGEKENDKMVLNIKLTHQDIAEMAGLTRETVTRVIDKWQKDGEIILKNRLISLSPDFLQKM